MSAPSARTATVVIGMSMIHPDAEDHLAAHCAAVVRHDGPQSELGATLAATGADALVVRAPMHVTEADLVQGKQLRVITSSGAGYDSVDVDGATRLGLPLLNVPGTGADTVAEYVIGALVAIGRGLVRLDRLSRDQSLDWGRRLGDLMGFELRGATLGIVGLGRIGSRVATLAQALGMRVVAADRGHPAPAGVTLLPFTDVLATADAIVVTVPRTPATLDLLGAAEFAAMKAGALLVNVGRGGVVDEGALAAALRTGHLGGAAIDVFADEPEVWRSPLLDAPNCLMTPHVAGLTTASSRTLAMTAAANLVKALDGDWTDLPIVNPEVLG